MRRAVIQLQLCQQQLLHLTTIRRLAAMLIHQQKQQAIRNDHTNTSDRSVENKGSQLTPTFKCASYVDTAAVIAPKFATPIVAKVDALEAANATCTPTVRYFTVLPDAQLESNEQLALTGDAKALGEWQLDRCVVLQTHDGAQWSANVTLQACRPISYRYLVFVEDRHGRRHIRRWETQPQPRILSPQNVSCMQVDRFGDMGMHRLQINRGWLTHASIVQLKFEREKMFRVLDIDKFDPEHVHIKIVPLVSEPHAQPEQYDMDAHVEVTKLVYGQSQLQPQDLYGVSWKRGEIVIFHVTVPEPTQTAYAVLFHSVERKLLGQAIIHGAALMHSEGVLELAIDEPASQSGTRVAELSLPFVVVKPFTQSTLDFRTTFAHDWPKSWPNLDVGHRGNGRSYIADAPAERENTIASFRRAYEGYADMIELDVHLTADAVPIIYHDFGVRTAPQGKLITNVDQLEFVLVKDVSYEVLKRLRIFAVINDKPVEYPAHNAEPRREHRIFPTLVDIFEGLPKTLGIDVEIKWPQRTAAGGVEALQTIDKNFFIDRIIDTVLRSGCGRPLIFSSFDADICTMLRFKQNIFPVMFLTMGETKKWSPFLDLRTRNFEQAVNNAQAFELAGTAPHAEDFLGANGAELIRKAQDLDQITIVWGDDCNSKERVRYFKEIGTTATCYDRTDLYMHEDKQASFFNSSRLAAEFEAQCTS